MFVCVCFCAVVKCLFCDGLGPREDDHTLALQLNVFISIKSPGCLLCRLFSVSRDHVQESGLLLDCKNILIDAIGIHLPSERGHRVDIVEHSGDLSFIFLHEYVSHISLQTITTNN